MSGPDRTDRFPSIPSLFVFDFNRTMTDSFRFAQISQAICGKDVLKHMTDEMKTVENGGITSPEGFTAGAVNAGIRSDRSDMALLLSETDASTAGVFTTNRVFAAPVALCRKTLSHGKARAILINSGNANACTGTQGMDDAQKMATLTASELGVSKESVFVCSTGTIGIPLPMDKIEAGIPLAAAALSAKGGHDAACAIMTTDTVPKETAVSIHIDGHTVHIGGMAKGSGMIEPNMATMLAFITTDALVPSSALQSCLSDCVSRTFNTITVDGDQSTNDTVLLLANGAAGNAPLTPDHPQWKTFTEAVEQVCMTLARAIVKDGEGATKLVSITVQNAATHAEATAAAKAIANSLLCKTAWFGGDPNWGRVIAAVGYSGAEVQQDQIDIQFSGLPAVTGGQLSPETSLEALAAVYARDAFEITVDLHIGNGSATVLTCDCSYDYVRINADYMT